MVATLEMDEVSTANNDEEKAKTNLRETPFKKNRLQYFHRLDQHRQRRPPKVFFHTCLGRKSPYKFENDTRDNSWK